MENRLTSCPYCSNTVMKGAMRCVACGKILQTPEKQIAALEKLQSSQKFTMYRLRNYAVIIIVLGVLYYSFSERIFEIIQYIISLR